MDNEENPNPVIIRLVGSDKQLDLHMSRDFVDKICAVPGVGLFGTRICLKGSNHRDWIVLAEVVKI